MTLATNGPRYEQTERPSPIDLKYGLYHIHTMWTAFLYEDGQKTFSFNGGFAD